MTQGLISILINGNVVMKIITGCDGRDVEKVAEEIRKTGQVPSLDKAYKIAKKHFTDKESLVVLNQTTEKYEGDDKISNLYRSTFNQATFNPRLESGEFEYLSIVNLFTY